MEVFEFVFEMIFELIMFVVTLFPLFLFIFILVMSSKSSQNIKNNNSANINRKDYEGIIRAGGRHYHKGSVGTTRKDEEWEETRCQKYKEEAFGKDTCSTYIKPDYDSLTCEDEDLSGG